MTPKTMNIIGGAFIVMFFALLIRGLTATDTTDGLNTLAASEFCGSVALIAFGCAKYGRDGYVFCKA